MLQWLFIALEYGLWTNICIQIPVSRGHQVNWSVATGLLQALTISSSRCTIKPQYPSESVPTWQVSLNHRGLNMGKMGHPLKMGFPVQWPGRQVRGGDQGGVYFDFLLSLLLTDSDSGMFMCWGWTWFDHRSSITNPPTEIMALWLTSPLRDLEDLVDTITYSQT